MWPAALTYALADADQRSALNRTRDRRRDAGRRRARKRRPDRSTGSDVVR
jgi:hypothetical protein